MKQALRMTDWFKSMGYCLGQYKSRDKYYIVDSQTGKQYEFDSLWQAQQFVESNNLYYLTKETNQ